MSKVTRIMQRRADPGREKVYEELARGMLETCSRAKGYLFSTLIPPRVVGEEFHVIQTFASQADLDAWSQSPTAHEWHDRIAEVSGHDPDYRTFNTTDLWFSASELTASEQPSRWRMAIVIWMGIFPIASFYVWFLFPFLEPVPFVPRMLIFTVLIVITMFYGALPYLLRWMGWFLHK
ncbi:antibiotic biosynthesis monooxygenase protein (plasmid) [Rhizobium etli bv. phaseoli str. IE4803]|nr:antibiotic biosynthesis monooxygenase protein [Rhizobium etli bv. phaseoli str. IE4803]